MPADTGHAGSPMLVNVNEVLPWVATAVAALVLGATGAWLLARRRMLDGQAAGPAQGVR